MISMGEFKVGDLLEASDFDKINYNVNFVKITSINYETEIYHWEAVDFKLGGKLHSGYPFNESKRYLQ